MDDPKYDVFVQFEPDEYVYVTSCSSDIGEIVCALQVLFPQMIGCSVDPFKEAKDE